jgi:Ser/Thr protein kinase RdoA (MazF antagonist)
MNFFPAQYSTLSSAALRDYIEKAYGFAGITCRLLVRNVSDVYLLEHNVEKYIFKVYRTSYRKLSEIESEVELLNILKGRDIPVSYPIRDLLDNQIQHFIAFEGERHGVLFSFAKGKVEINPDYGQLRIFGRTLAQMHQVTSNPALQFDRITYDFETTAHYPLKIIEHRFTELPNEYAFLQELAQKTIETLNSFDASKFSYGYCHYDLLPKNFHFDEHNNITLFDFDWMGKGWLANDLMTFYVQLFFLAHMLKRIPQAEADRSFAIVVESYREHRELSDAELAAIPYLGVLFWIYAFGFYEENFDDFSNTFLSTRFIRERVGMIRTWAEQYCKF